MKSKKNPSPTVDDLQHMHTRADWEAQARKELRTGDTLENLLWKYVPEVPLGAFFNHESLSQPLAQAPPLASTKQQTPSPRNWGHTLYVTLEQLEGQEDYTTFCTEHEVNELLVDVGTGVRHIEKRILKKVQLLNIETIYRCEAQYSSFFKALTPHSKFVWEIEAPIKDQYTQGNCVDLTFMESQSLSLVWQLAYVLSRGEIWMRNAERKETWTIINMATADYYHEIAKLRAIRLCLAKLAALHHKPWFTDHLRILGAPGLSRATHLAPTMNLIRYTTDIMAMLLGGITDLMILPHGRGLSPRLTANISHIFAHEAHISDAREAAEGAYFFEYLTHRLSEEAWRVYEEWKRQGGIESTKVQHMLKEACKQSWSDQQYALSTGTRTMIGVNRYVFVEKQETPTPPSAQHKGFYTDMPRVSAAYEEIYTQSVDVWKKHSPPIVHLVGEGHSVQARAAHLYLRDGWELIGIEAPTILIDPYASLPKKPFVWQLCLSEQIQEESILQLIETASHKTDYTIWVCGYPKEKPQVLQNLPKLLYVSYQAPPLENWRKMKDKVSDEIQLI